MVRESNGADSLYRKQSHIFSSVAVCNEVKPSRRVPEPIRIYLSAADCAAGCRKIAHLRRFAFIDSLGDEVYGVPIPLIILVRSKANGKQVIERTDILVPLWR